MPSTADQLEGEDVARARSAVPPDVRPRAILRSDSCASYDPDAILLVTKPGGEGAISGETIRTRVGDALVLELELPTALEPSSSYEACVDGEDGRICVAFETLEGTTEPPAPPVLALGAPEVDEDGEWLVVSARADTSWSPFVGVTWIEVRDGRPPGLPLVLAYDAEAKVEDRAVVSGHARAGQEVCFVAVARAADGDTAASEPSCLEATPPPDAGCSLAAAPSGSSWRVAVLAGIVGLAAARARRRARRRGGVGSGSA